MSKQKNNMTKKLQMKKNMILTSKLLDYLAKHPDVASEYPSGTSYVVFSSKDHDLNEENEKMAENLVKKGKKIVKATNKPGPNPWNFQFI